MNEIWKDVVGYEDSYQVSNAGKIRSVSKNVQFGKNIRATKNRLLKGYVDKDGYVCLQLYKNNRATHKKIHRLVCEAFIPNKENKKQVNHKNGIKDDNRVENLEWATPSENIRHSFKQLGHKSTWFGKSGVENPNSKAVLQLKNGVVVNVYGSAREAERKTGFNRGYICSCCRHEHKQAYGFEWRYKNGRLL